jgi:cation:H+ antiporter
LEALPIWINALLFLLGLGIIAKGADWFTDASVSIAEATRVPKAIIGATIVSVATTLPEFSVSLTAALSRQPQTAIGNAVGSTICNIGLILATMVLIRPVIIEQDAVRKQGVFMVLAGAAVILLAIRGTLSRGGGLVLVAGFVAYIWYSINTARSHRRGHQALDSTERDSKEPGPQIGFFLLGAAGVVVGSMLLVKNARVLAEWLDVPELVVGLTAVAVGTSLPEYVTAITATLKGHGELGVGNVIGANILDLVWVLGVSALTRPLHLERQTQVLDLPLMLLIMVLLVVMIGNDSSLKRWEGAVLFGVYMLYLALMLTLFVGGA